MTIDSIDKMGIVMVSLSKEIIAPSNLSAIDDTILDLTVITDIMENKDKLKFDWKVTEFNTTQFKI